MLSYINIIIMHIVNCYAALVSPVDSLLALVDSLASTTLSTTLKTTLIIVAVC